MVYRRTQKTELQKLERRTRILREAQASIASAGFGGSKIKKIAKRADLSEVAVYRYFSIVFTKQTRLAMTLSLRRIRW